MFRKPFHVKSNSTIKGSDRRKLKQDAQTQFHNLTQEDLSQVLPNKEDMTVMKILAHNGATVTCYCLKKNPIFFEVEKVLYPTIYTLWRFPHMVPCLCTWAPVFENIIRGADLMLPGVIPSASRFGHFEKDDIMSVRLNGNGSPMAVGYATVSSKDIAEKGMKGKCIIICHWYSDHLWASGDKSEPPLLAEHQSTNQMSYMDHMTESNGCHMTQSDECHVTQSDGQPENQNGISKLTEDGPCHIDELLSSNLEQQCSVQEGGDEENVERCAACPNDNELKSEASALDGIENIEPQRTPQEEFDWLLENCFLQALLNAKKVALPMLVSTFSAQYLHPACPEGRTIDVKKSSFKKMSKFMQHMQSRGLLEVKEKSKGVDEILSIKFLHEDLKNFKSSEFAREIQATKKKSSVIENSKQDILQIIDLYSVSGKTVKFFKMMGRGKGTVLSGQEIRAIVTEYVKTNELVSEGNKKFVTIDPILTETLLEKNEYDTKLTWDSIFNRFCSRMNPCHQLNIPGKEPVVRKGKMEPIELSIEQRMGNKKVTLVKNLEQFGIDPKDFAQKLQQMAASSTTVNPLPGKISPGLQVLVQGKQLTHVANLLDEFHIPRKYVNGLEKVKEGKKKR